MDNTEVIVNAVKIALNHAEKCTDPELCIDDPIYPGEPIGCIEAVRREVVESMRAQNKGAQE